MLRLLVLFSELIMIRYRMSLIEFLSRISRWQEHLPEWQFYFTLKPPREYDDGIYSIRPRAPTILKLSEREVKFSAGMSRACQAFDTTAIL